MKIALFQYPDYAIPTHGYGPKQLLIELLAEGFMKAGHEVTTFATADTRLSGKIVKISPVGINEGLNDDSEIQPDVERIYRSIAIGELLRLSKDFDVIHNHAGFTILPIVQALKAPVFHTLHGTYTNKHYLTIFRKYAQSGYFVPISKAQAAVLPDVSMTRAVYHGIRVTDYKYQDKATSDTLLFLGRLSRVKGAHTAIKIAQASKHKLIIAGPLDVARAGGKKYFEEEIKPHIDNKQIRYIGEVQGKKKRDLLANSKALLFPIEWVEAFGLVMIEALMSGTPVIAYDIGSPKEVISSGVTGYVCPRGNIKKMVEAVKSVAGIDRAQCRREAIERFSADIMVKNYLEVFKEKIKNG